MPPRLGDLALACPLVGRGLHVVVLERLRVSDDLFLGAEDRGVDSAELLALIRDEALAWSPEVKLGRAGVELVFACRGDGVAISGGTVTDVSHPVAVVGLVLPRVRRRITLVSHSLACIGKPIAVVGQACTLVGCAIALVGECLSAHQSGVTVADSGVGCGRAPISDASRRAEGFGGFCS